MNIFVSYTTKDSEVTLHRLNEISIKLRQIGYVYIDIIHNNSQDKQKRVFEELDNSDVIILIISNNVYNSKWVIKEIERAYKQFTPIVPFTINEIIRHYKIFCVNGNTGFRNESRIFYFIHLQNEEAYERKESSSA